MFRIRCNFSKFISTHSLTRRLTVALLRGKEDETYFNSQPHKEADSKEQVEQIANSIFQLTASQGG